MNDNNLDIPKRKDEELVQPVSNQNVNTISNPVPQENMFDVPSQNATQVIEQINTVNNDVNMSQSEPVSNPAAISTSENQVKPEQNVIASTTMPEQNITTVVPEGNATQEQNTMLNQAPMDEPTSDSFEYNKKLVTVEAAPNAPEPVKKSNGGGVIVFFFILLLLCGGVYYVGSKGIVNIPYITPTTTKTTTTTTTTLTTTTVVSSANIATGIYNSVNDKCSTEPMSLTIADGGVFSLKMVDDTCTVTSFSGAFSFNKETNTVNFVATDGTSFNATTNDKVILLNFNGTGYSFKI